MSKPIKTPRIVSFILALCMILTMVTPSAALAGPVYDEYAVGSETIAEGTMAEASVPEPASVSFTSEPVQEPVAGYAEPTYQETTVPEMEPAATEDPAVTDEPAAPAEQAEFVAPVEQTESEEDAAQPAETDQPADMTTLVDTSASVEDIETENSEEGAAQEETYSEVPQESGEVSEEDTADPTEETAEETDDEPIEEPESVPEVKTSSIKVIVKGEGGSISFTGTNKYLLESKENGVSVKDAAGNIIEKTDKDYDLIFTDETGRNIGLFIKTADGYRISEYRYYKDSEEIYREDTSAEITELKTEFELPENDLVLYVAFEKIPDPYFISDNYDYSIYSGLDFSSGRFLVGTYDPSIFVDASVVISGYKGIYILQFADTNTALRAYAYYMLHAEFVELDGTIYINDDAYLEEGIPVADAMTIENNPFSELEEAIVTSGYGYYDIALIDTGANGADESVSMLGDYTGDDNGHGTLMLGYIRQHNPNARVLSIKAMDAGGQGDMSAVYAAIQYAISKNVKIINLSVSAFATADNDLLHYAIQQATGAGIIVVASAGNNGRNASWYIPGAYSEVLTVGACDETGVRRQTSNYGDAVNYNMVADTTSQAAAFMSGFLSLYGYSGIEYVLNSELIFTPDYVPADEPEEPEEPGITDPGHQEIEGLEVEETKSFLVKYTFIDADDYVEGMTFTDFFDSGKSTLGQKEVYVTAYINGDEYVFYADQPYLNEYAAKDPVYWDFAEGNDSGVTITEGVSFNPESKIARVKAAVTGTGSEFADIQLQLMIPVTLNDSVHIPIAVSSNTNDIKFAVSGTVEARPFFDLSFQLIDESSSALIRSLYEIDIYINGDSKALDTTAYTYDCSTGVIELYGYTGFDVTSLAVHINLMDDETLIINGYWDGTSTVYLADSPETLSTLTSVSAYLKNFDPTGIKVGQYEKVNAKVLVGGAAVPTGGDTWLWYATKSKGTGPKTPGLVENYADTAVFVGLPKTIFGQDFTLYEKSTSTKGGKYGTGYDNYNPAFYTYCHHVSSALYNGTINSAGTIVTVPFIVRLIDKKVTSNGYKMIFSVESTKAESVISGGIGQAIGAVFTVESIVDRGALSFTKTASDTESSLTISKDVTSSESGDADKAFSFTLEYGSTTEYGTTETFTLKNSESVSFNLPAGSFYRITEEDNSTDGWKSKHKIGSGEWEDGNVVTGQMPAGQAGSAVFCFTVTGLSGKHDWYYNGSRYGTNMQNHGLFYINAGDVVAITDIDAGSNVTIYETYPIYTYTGRNLESGSKGGDVYGVQCILCDAGYLSITPDGVYGTETEAAVNRLRGENGLTQNGKVTSDLVGYLNALSAEYTGNWSGGGSTSGAIVKNKTTNISLNNVYNTPGVSVAFSNSHQIQDGDLYFAKEVKESTGTLKVSKERAGETEFDDEFEFTLLINGTAGAGYAFSGSKTGTTDSEGKFTLKAGQSVVITGIPAGATYTVTETPVTTASGNPKFHTTVTDNDGNTSDGREVSGKLENAPSDVKFEFTVTGLPEGTYEYSIYNSLDASGAKASSGTISNNGKITLGGGQSAKITGIKAGTTVTVTEELPSEKWSCDKTDKKVSETVVSNETTLLGKFTNTFAPDGQEVTVYNGLDKGFVCLKKTSQSYEFCEENSLYSLEGAVYEVYSNSSLTNKVATLTTKADGTTEAVELPVGTYYVIETKASAGHKLDASMTKPRSKTVNITEQNTESEPAVVTSTDPVLNDPMKIDITKNGGDYLYAFSLEGVKFEIRYYDNLEKDITGTPLRTWTIQTRKNAAGNYSARLDDAFLVEGSDELFKIDGTTTLLLGTYTIEEISTADGYTLAGGYMYANSDPETKVDTDGGKIVIVVDSEDEDVVISTGNEFTGYNQPVEIDTEALGATLGANIYTHYIDVSQGFGMIIDTVSFKALDKNVKYRLTGQLYDRNTAKPVGNSVTTTFETDSSGEADSASIRFAVNDIENMAGHVLVACQTLEAYIGDKWIKVAEEFDLNQEKQSVHLIRIGTTLLDKDTKDHIAQAAENKLVDTVSYEGLTIGQTYTLKAELKNRQTGKTVATAEKTFTAETANGSVDVEFTYKTSEGESLTAFEGLYFESSMIAQHKDIDDEDQSIYVPEIRTTLKDSKDSLKEAAASENMKLVDTVFYTNLVPGKEYKVKGTLMLKATGEKALDDKGNEITAESLFTPETAEGSVDITFEFSGVSLAGMSIVAFETLEYKNIEVAVHADINDEDQTVAIPKIGTTLKDKADDGHDALAEEDITLVDTVAYDGLTAGRKYTVTGTLMDKETGKPALDDKGKEITSQEEFTPSKSSGTVDITFTFSGVKLAGHSVVAFESLYNGEKEVAVHADINDEGQTVDIPKVETTLKDSADSEKDVLAAEDITLVDTVKYTNLKAGKEYTVKGTLMDKDTGKPALDDKGSEITAETVFTAESENGEAEITFKFSGVKLAGKTLVAFEDLYRDGKKIAVHAEIDDEDQTVYVPEIGTTLVDTTDNGHDVLASEEITLADTVTYKNLIPGREYTVKGTLMDKETGKALLDDSGKEITAEKTFTAEASDGSIEVEFKFSGASLKGHATVAFEELYRENKKVAVHADIDDEAQTVEIPKVQTTLNDSIDGRKDALANERIVLTDKVLYENLTVGKEYTVKGTLMDKETGKPALDDNGNKITAEKSFIAETADGSVDITFEFSGVNLAGRSVVAFEDIYRDKKQVAVHADIEDEDQTVDIPKIGTTLTDKVDGDKDVLASEEITLVDTVAYENLHAGVEYTVTGVLYDKKTGEPALDDKGSKIEASASFVAEAASGEAELSFTFSGVSLAGHTVVAFEELYREEKLLAVHADIDDEDQSVYVPEIRTTLKDSTDDSHDVLATEEIVLTDTVKYSNLLIGREYTVTGKLYDKETGKPVLNDNGEEITAESTVTPETASGTVDVVFKFSGVNLAGKSLVAFEDLYRGKKQVAVHADINDEDQTVDIPKIGTTLADIIDKEHDALAADEIRLFDTVAYENLEAGKMYTVKGILYDKETGEPVLDDNGEEITGETEFEAESADGAVEVEFVFSGVSLAGKTVVAFEELYRDSKKVAVHAEIEDNDQAVLIPEIGTTLNDTIDNDKDALAAEEIELKDTVSYKNLIPGREYTVVGILMDKKTEEPALDDSENNIKSVVTFTPEEAAGTVEVTFKFSGVNLAGHTVVAFEQLYRDDKLVAVHCDIDDIDQSIFIPKVETTLKDTVDGEHDAYASETIRLIDTVTYYNLFVGREYEVTGKLYDKETGEPALDDNGNEITSTVKFTPVYEDGTVDILFEFSGVNLAGHSVVAFEDVTRNGKKVAVHADIDDEDQTVIIPKIGTTLIDKVDDEHDALAEKDITLVDTVAYENLMPGREYTVTGKLMDKDTGLPALDDKGREITAESSFTAEEAAGSVDITFKFSGVNLAGHTTVAFETLYRDGKEVAVHADIEDEDQSVHIPEIRTTLKDNLDDEHDAFATEDIVLIDEVRYSNLLPGREYTVKGILMDKDTGEPALDDDGNEITAESTFTAEEPEGSVEITFAFSGVNLAGHTTVAFEDLYRDEKHVAVHADINDKEQTVQIPKIGTTLTDPESGLHNTYAGETVTLKDTVAYENLIVGRTYTVRGTLMDRTTGSAVKNSDGSDVKSEVTFVAETSSGSIDLEFTYDNVPDEGIITVAFEKLFRTSIDGTGEKEVAEHEVIDDDGQTVGIPDIRTTLKGEGGLNTVNGVGTVVLTDTVKYENLMPGHEYTVKGTLINKDTSKIFTDASGNAVTAETVFTAEASSGTVDVVFTFTQPDKTCKELVAFEYLYEAETLIADHEDINDIDQTVNVLSLSTLATFRNGDKRALSHLEQTVTDSITYSQLEPGTYVIRTTMMKKENGSVMTSNGVPVTAEKTVKLTEKDGVVSIEIVIPRGTLLGDAVVFEEFYQVGDDGREVLVGEHRDINDAAQMVSLYTETTTVRTGDENHLLLFLIISVSALAVIGGCVILLVRKRRREE